MYKFIVLCCKNTYGKPNLELIGSFAKSLHQCVSSIIFGIGRGSHNSFSYYKFSNKVTFNFKLFCPLRNTGLLRMRGADNCQITHPYFLDSLGSKITINMQLTSRYLKSQLDRHQHYQQY